MYSRTDWLARNNGYSSYQEYLKSEYWLEFSDSVRKEFCYCCGKKRYNLQIHHLTYERFGHELPSDIITVCNGCHIFIHEISKNGIPLEKAHIICRKRISEHKKSEQRVSWFRLLNKSKHQTIGQLMAFLIKKGLSDGEKATEKAYKSGFVYLEDGKERWCRKKYIKMLQADKKLEKLQKQGKIMTRNIHRLAAC